MPLAPAAPPRAAPAIAVALSARPRLRYRPLRFRWLLFSGPTPPPDPASPRYKPALHPLDYPLRLRRSRLHEGEQPASPPNPVSALALVPRTSCGPAQPASSRATAPRRRALRAVRLGGRAWDSQGGVPLGRGMGRAAPCAMRLPGFFSGFPGGGARRHPRAGASALETRGGRGAGAGAGLGARGWTLAAEAPPRLGTRRGRSRWPRPSGLRSRLLCEGLREQPSLLMWCLSRALPALTTIMSMPSKRTGTSPSGVLPSSQEAASSSNCSRVRFPSLKPPSSRGWLR